MSGVEWETILSREVVINYMIAVICVSGKSTLASVLAKANLPAAPLTTSVKSGTIAVSSWYCLGRTVSVYAHAVYTADSCSCGGWT